MRDRLGHAFDARGNDRHAGRHRFEHDHRQAFAEQAGQHEQVDLRQLAIHAAREADPVDRLGQAEPLGQAANRRLRRRAFRSRRRPAAARSRSRDRSTASASSSTSMPLRGRNRATVPSVHVPPGGRRSWLRAGSRHAVGHADDALGRNAAVDHVLRASWARRRSADRRRGRQAHSTMRVDPVEHSGASNRGRPGCGRDTRTARRPGGRPGGRRARSAACGRGSGRSLRLRPARRSA